MSDETTEVEVPYDLELRYPVKVHSKDGELLETVSKLTYRRRPNAGDLMAADGKGKVGMVLTICSRLTGQPMHIIERLDVRGGDESDAQRALAVVDSFF